MFAASSYQIIYLILVSILTLFVCGRYSNSKRTNDLRVKGRRHLVGVGFAVMISLFIGLRPVSPVFVDMINYADIYEVYTARPFVFNWYSDNIIFDNLLLLFASFGINKILFFLIISFVYFLCMFAACKKLFPNDAFLVFIVCLAAFSTFSYGVNGIKAGAAASVFLLALAYHEHIIPSLLLAIVSYGFHHAMQVPVLAWVIVLFFHDSRVFIFFWILCVVLAAFHFTFVQEFLASVTDETGSVYLSNTDPYNQSFTLTGFRPDFILYSAVPVLIGAYMVLIQRVVSKEYNYLLCFYLLTNSVWMLCMYAEFTNRIAYLSWFVYPIVLIYPFVYLLKGKRAWIPMNMVVYGHLLFTLFMFFIYQ